MDSCYKTEEELILHLQAVRLKNNLSDTAFTDVLGVIQNMPRIWTQSKSPLNSLYLFDKFLGHDSLETPNRFYFCTTCFSYYSKDETNCIQCNELLGKGDNYFIYTPMKQQIRSFLEVERNRQLIIDYAHKLAAMDPQLIHDHISSKRCMEIKAKHDSRFNAHNMNSSSNMISHLTIGFNTDGVEFSKSSSKSLYPVMVAIHQLPPSAKQRNINIPFLFVATKKVKFDQRIFRPLIDELKELEEDGADWVIDGQTVNTKIYCSVGCFDAPVKSKMLAIPGHSSKTGCPLATCTGIWVEKGKGGAVVYADPEMGDPRDPGESMSILAEIPSMAPVLFKSISLDSLHGIYIGVTKYLVNIWLTSPNVTKKVRNDRTNICDSVLSSIKPPYWVERFPRGFSEDSKHWKAHEWRNFLFFYSTPILIELVKVGLIADEVLDHWTNLVQGVSLLNKASVSQQDITAADEVLKSFVGRMEEVYGVESSTYNVHMLLHLASSVEYLGPLWSVSMFVYEGYNKIVLQSFNGSSGVTSQIAKRLSQRKDLYKLQEVIEMKNPYSPAIDHGMFQSMHPKSYKYSHELYDFNMISLVKQTFPETATISLKSYGQLSRSPLKVMTASREASGNFKSSNCFIYSTSNGCYGQVQALVNVCGTETTYVVFNKIVTHAKMHLAYQQFDCAVDNALLGVDMLDACKVAIKIPMLNNIYNRFSIGHQPNYLEKS